MVVISMMIATLWIAGSVAPSSGSDFMMKGPREEVIISDLYHPSVGLTAVGSGLVAPTTDIKPFGIMSSSQGF